MARRTAKARGKCPYCNKANVSMSISVRREGGVNAVWGTHKGMYVDTKSGKALDCTGSKKPVDNAAIPPMNTWK